MGRVEQKIEESISVLERKGFLAGLDANPALMDYAFIVDAVKWCLPSGT